MSFLFKIIISVLFFVLLGSLLAFAFMFIWNPCVYNGKMLLSLFLGVIIVGSIFDSIT
jgi:hypothetical protein